MAKHLPQFLADLWVDLSLQASSMMEVSQGCRCLTLSHRERDHQQKGRQHFESHHAGYPCGEGTDSEKLHGESIDDGSQDPRLNRGLG